MRNVGNEVLQMGDNTNITVHLSGIDEIDFDVVAQPYQLILTETGEPADVTLPIPEEELELYTRVVPGIFELDINEWCYFDLGFNPRSGVPNAQTGQQPEESERFVNVLIDSNDPPFADSADPDNFVFTIRGTAKDPHMRVRGQGFIIADRDFTPRVEDDTTYNNVDMWGGELSHTFIVENAGRIHDLCLLQPTLDVIETIDGIHAYVPTDGSTIQVSGADTPIHPQRPNTYAFRTTLSRWVLSQLWFTRWWNFSVRLVLSWALTQINLTHVVMVLNRPFKHATSN